MTHREFHLPRCSVEATAIDTSIPAGLQLGGEVNVIEAPGIPGDINGDGEVAFADFLILSDAFGSDVDPPGSGADIDGDGNVGFADFLILSDKFWQCCCRTKCARAIRSRSFRTCECARRTHSPQAKLGDATSKLFRRDHHSGDGLFGVSHVAKLLTHSRKKR